MTATGTHPALGAILARPSVRRWRETTVIGSRLSLTAHRFCYMVAVDRVDLLALADELEQLAADARTTMARLVAEVETIDDRPQAELARRAA